MGLDKMFTNSLPSKALTAYEVEFLVFSGTALSKLVLRIGEYHSDIHKWDIPW